MLRLIQLTEDFKSHVYDGMRVKMGFVHFWRIFAPPQLVSVRYKYVTYSMLLAGVCYNCMVLTQVTYYGYRQETYLSMLLKVCYP